MSLSLSDRRRLSDLADKIQCAYASLTAYYQARNTGWVLGSGARDDIAASYCRQRAREILRELRHYQLRAARLRLRSGG